MYHFFAMHDNIFDDHIDIIGNDVNHIKNVLRLCIGDEILISSGDNVDYTCKISEETDDYIRADILGADERGRELASKVYLFQGLPKNDKMELIVQKMVELGAFEIVPVSMKRSVVKLDGKKAEQKVARWNAIAESAAKQSKRSVMPKVHEVCSFKEALEYAASLDVKLLPYECAEGMEHTRNIVGSIENGKSVGIFIGPEGGFDSGELEDAKENGWNIITLGRRILRTETAGMMLMSVLMYNMEE
jgi:16S rRNA (uracil1498-N3)-methyltransferase